MTDPAARAREDARWAGTFAIPVEPDPEPAPAGPVPWRLGVLRCWECGTVMGEPPGPCERCGWTEQDETEWTE